MVKKDPNGRSPKKPTVGRHDDLPWVAEATYRRFFPPTTAGRYLVRIFVLTNINK